ncbi:MAG: tetratricopeptide repeat protein [Betaproteobacteria bacterium]
MANPDGSTVTFLFTDVEGSTRLWEQSPVQMGPALARHDALLRDAIARHRGTVFATGGDGFGAAFATAGDAAAAALEAQQSVLSEPWPAPIAIKVRMALHTGVAEVRGTDYFGPSLNRVARLLAIGHGNQVLISEAAADALQGAVPHGASMPHRASMPHGASLQDRGRHRLKDLQEAEQVFQLCHADLPRELPPLRSLSTHPNNLPQQLTSFIGREKEIVDVKALMTSGRLVTLTGSGGCGKTRLAVQVAADALESYPDGAWMVELAALADPALVTQTVANELGLKESRGKTIEQSLVEHLSSRRALLVLDNAEHLLAECAQLADTLLRRCAKVALLVSSREGLSIAGEATYRVPSLPMPDPKQDKTPEQVGRFESTRLFVERARLHAPGFEVTAQNAVTLASICSRLDGIPLAIELAAARMRSMSIDELNKRLDQRFRLLSGGSRTALPRQQTLRSLIDWSYDLLKVSEQALLCRLAIFVGGWTLEAAESVCSGDGVDEAAMLDVLTSLVDKSLVQIEEGDTGTRYRLLETVRQYARDRLLERGDGAQWRDRHLAYFVAAAEATEPLLTGVDQRSQLDSLEAEHDNLRAALTWSCVESGDTVAGARLAAALHWFWFVRGYLGEGRAWFVALLAALPVTEAHSGLRAKALIGAGELVRQQGEYAAARVLFLESLDISKRLGDDRGVAAAQVNIGLVDYHLGDYDGARVLLDQSTAAQRALGDQAGLAFSLNTLGMLRAEQGAYAQTRTLYEESLAIRRQLGDHQGIGQLLNNLAIIASHQGDFVRARGLYEEGLAIRRELRDKRGIALMLNNMAMAAAQQGDPSGYEMFEEALVAFRELGDQRGIALSLTNLGSVAHEQGNNTLACRRLEEAITVHRTSGDRQGSAMSLIALAHVVADMSDPARSRALYAESLAIVRALGDRRSIAEALEGLARAALSLKDALCAARIWGAAARLREEIGAPLHAGELPRYQAVVATARASCEAAAFDAAWQAGRAEPLEQAMDAALARG